MSERTPTSAGDMAVAGLPGLPPPDGEDVGVAARLASDVTDADRQVMPERSRTSGGHGMTATTIGRGTSTSTTSGRVSDHMSGNQSATTLVPEQPPVMLATHAPAPPRRSGGGRNSSSVLITGLTLLTAALGVGFMLWQSPSESDAGAANTNADAEVNAILGGLAPSSSSGGGKGDPGKFKWHDNLDDAFIESDRTGLPLLVRFSADWCPPCRQLDRKVLQRRDVKETMRKNYIAVEIDLTDRQGPNNQIAQQFGVRGIPHIRVLDANANDLGEIPAIPNADHFLSMLKEGPR